MKMRRSIALQVQTFEIIIHFISDDQWKELANKALIELTQLSSIDAWPSPKPLIKMRNEWNYANSAYVYTKLFIL